VLIAVDRSKEILKQGIKLIKDEKTGVKVVKIVQSCEGDPHLLAIGIVMAPRMYRVPKPKSVYWSFARSPGFLIFSRLQEVKLIIKMMM